MANGHREIRFREPGLSAFAWGLALLLSIFILYPILRVVLQSLRDADGGWTLQAYTAIFSLPRLRQPIINTLTLGLASAVSSTVIGFLFAYAVTRTDLGGKKFWKLTATFPMISPPFLVALSAIVLFGNNGLVTAKLLGGVEGFSIYGFWGLWIAQTIAFFPTAFLVCSGLLVSIDPALEEAALNAGAGKVRAFFHVLLPLSFPALASSFLLVFIESLADFANPLVLSGNFRVLSVEAYLKIVGSELDLAGGSALALFLLVPSLLAFLVQQVWLSRKSFVTLTGKPSSAAMQSLGKTGLWGWGIACGFFAGAIYLFYGTVFVGSFMKVWPVDPSFTLDHYTRSLQMQWGTISDSLLLAGIATPFSGLLGIAVAYLVVRTRLRIRHAIEWISLLTFAVPGTVVGIGYVLAFNEPPLLLQGTGSAIVLLFIFRNAPVGIRASVAALMQIDRSIDEASANLGATRGQTVRKILLPLLAPAFISGLSYAFVRGMNAISAVIFVVSGKWNLITISIMNFFETGDLGKAAALCFVLIALVASAIALFQWILPRTGARRFV